jgi:ActR/RegA family two-component response regulator
VVRPPVGSGAAPRPTLWTRHALYKNVLAHLAAGWTSLPLATILIEDSPAIRSSLIPALADFANVEVIATAETADQGISALKAHADKWRLAIVDMLLKAGNGLQVLRAGRQRRSDQYMIVLTNYATPDIRRKSIECGADAVFDKSTEIGQFLELCRQYSVDQAPRAANAPSAPWPGESAKGSPAPEKVIGVEELLERVAIDRLLTEAVSGLVERNAAAVRDHLKRQGLASKVPAANEPRSDEMDSPRGSTPENLPDGE